MASNSQTNECYVFFGTSGAGKSTTINTLCGEKQCKEGHGERSETQGCKLVNVNKMDSVFYGKSLLDMQGFNDTRPKESREKILEMTKLYFVESRIQKVKCIIFVVSMAESRTDFYLCFIKYLKYLFSEKDITTNMIALFTNSDKLNDDAKKVKLESMNECILEIKNDEGYSIEVVEWSNKKPLPDQEKKLFNAISKMPGFDPKWALENEEKKIDQEAQRRYESEENIQMVHYDAKMELQEFVVERKQEDIIVLQDDQLIEQNVPREMLVTQLTDNRVIRFQGHINDDVDTVSTRLENNIVRLGSMMLISKAMSTWMGRINRTQTQTLEFKYPVLTVTLDKKSDDIHLLDKISATINPNNPRKVEVTADFSWGGSPVLTWDFGVIVTVTIETTRVIKEAYTSVTTVPRQKFEVVEKIVTDKDKQLVEVAKAYQEKIYKRTLEQIRRDVIRERILALT